MRDVPVLSLLGLVVGTTALVLSWMPIRFGRRYGFSKEVAAILSLIGLGLIAIALMLTAAAARP
jgi:hypothetical protein